MRRQRWRVAAGGTAAGVATSGAVGWAIAVGTAEVWSNRRWQLSPCPSVARGRSRSAVIDF